MKQQILNAFRFVVLVSAAVLLAFVFYPRHYEVPTLAKRASTTYWDLPTGSRIAYTLVPAQGTKKNSPIIYLHGGPGGPIMDSNIRSLAALAADGYDVYLYDQIGGGFSDRLKDIEAYTANRHKLDLEAIVQQIRADKVILIGQSWGAILATLYAADNPDKLEKIIFTCPGPIEPKQRALASLAPPDSLQLRPPIFSNAQGNLKVDNWRTRAITYFATAFGLKLSTDAEADNFATYRNTETNKSLVCDITKAPKASGGSGFYASLMTVYSLPGLSDPRSKLKTAPYPILVMKGQCDNQKWGFTNEYLEIFPNHQLVVIPDAGHAISVEQPELYIKTIQNFLRRPNTY